MSVTSPAGILHLVERLSSIPDRTCGTQGAADAAGEIEHALRELGLEVREEPFRFRQARAASSLLVAGGRSLPHVPLAYAGGGQVHAPAVDGGSGEQDLAQREECRGAVILVRRDAVRHRQAQYRACVDAGAAAMILISSAPGDAVQEGSVREAWEGPGRIPCLAVGALTGAWLLERATAGALAVEVSVELALTAATGRNLVAVVDGHGRSRGVEVGAHYDAWGPGAVDNASGCAALIAAAAHLVAKAPPSPVSLVAFDGEEIGLLGAWYRARHRRPGPGVLLDLEMPSSREAVIRALAATSAPACVEAADASGLSACYEVTGPMASVPELMGGSIPADVWPYYLAGVAALVTVCDTPHYHTAGDLPHTLEAEHLAHVAERAAECLRRLAAASPDHLAGKDVPRGALGAEWRGDALVVEASFAWEDGGRVEGGGPVEVLAFASDFELVARVEAGSRTNGTYQARLAIPSGLSGPLDLTAHLTALGESAEVHLRVLR